MMRKLFIPALVIVAAIFGAVTLMATSPQLQPSAIEPVAATVRVEIHLKVSLNWISTRIGVSSNNSMRHSAGATRKKSETSFPPCVSSTGKPSSRDSKHTK